jgi:hypothetical protein
MPRKTKKLDQRLSPEQKDKRRKRIDSRRKKKKILEGVPKDKWRRWRD